MFAGGQNASSASASRSAGAGVTGDARITRISGATPMQYDVRHYYTGFNWTSATLGQMTDVSFELWYKYQNASSFSITRIIARQGPFEYVAEHLPRTAEQQQLLAAAQRTFNATASLRFCLALALRRLISAPLPLLFR